MEAVREPHQAQRTQELPPQAQLMQMITGKAVTQSIFVAAKLGIADLLSEGVQSVDELAAATETDPSSLYRVLRALASLGIFAETDSGYFTLTPLAEPLRENAPESLRDLAIMFGCDWHNRAWSNLLHSVQSGQPAFDLTFGMDLFTYLHENPSQFAVFNNAMTALSRPEAGAICQAYDFSEFDTIVDVGGGHGFLLAEILKANPSLRGILLETPKVVDGTRATMAEAELIDRCQVVAGDFFEEVPEGAEAYILKLILHDWNDEDAHKILQTCREAMAPDGKILVANAVVPPGNEPYIGKLVDMEMMVMTPGGLERTESEFRQLFAEGGFELTRVIPTPSYLFILEGQPL